MSDKDNLRGQAIVIVVLLLFVIAALIALVVDGGNAYAQRRTAQNSVDTGVLAGIQAVAQEFEKETPTLKESELWDIITDYTARNGIEAADAQGWFIDIDGNRIEDIKPQGNNPVQKKYVDPDFKEKDVNGVEVGGALPFDTYFARVIGVDAMTAHATAKAWVWCGICKLGNLFPVAVSTDTFTSTNFVPVTGTYIIWDEGMERPGSFGWVHWDPHGEPRQNESEDVLVDNIEDTSRSGYWEVGEELPASNGEMQSAPVIDAVNDKVGEEIWIPVYDRITGSGSNTRYRIAYFAAFELTCIHFRPGTTGEIGVCTHEAASPQERWIEGKFLRKVDPSAEGICDEYGGVCTYKLRRPDQYPESSP